MIKNNNHFKGIGESMINAGILDGDIAILKKLMMLLMEI